MGVKSTVTLSRTSAIEAIRSASLEYLLKIPHRGDFLHKAGELFDWNVKVSLDPKLPLQEIEDKLEEVRDIHNPNGDYYFDNYCVVEDTDCVL